MSYLLRVSLLLAFSVSLFAQFPGLTLPPSGGNQKASVTQHVGPVTITIDYSSPAVHGPDGKDRKGQIWGKLVPYGLTNLGFGNNKPDPWRAGANENTVLTVSHDVEIEGHRLPAGRYGLFMIVDPQEWTLILSKDSGAWGSFFYDPARDALRVKLKPQAHAYREWLTYEFTKRKPDETTAELQWEDLAVPWSIKVPNINQLYISRLKEELNSTPGFMYQGYMSAAQFTVMTGTGLEQGLEWADAAISAPFIGDKNFDTLSTKAQVLEKLGRAAEAKQVMAEALREPTATPIKVHAYARQLQQAGRQKEAMEVFKINAEQHPGVWPVEVGLTRMYSAEGNYPVALEHAKKALAQVPDPLNKQSLEAMVKLLSEGKPVAQ
jgi:hypothetical protein